MGTGRSGGLKQPGRVLGACVSKTGTTVSSQGTKGGLVRTAVRGGCGAARIWLGCVLGWAVELLLGRGAGPGGLAGTLEVGRGGRRGQGAVKTGCWWAGGAWARGKGERVW